MSLVKKFESARYRVHRGGSWYVNSLVGRATYRELTNSGAYTDDLGFRLLWGIR